MSIRRSAKDIIDDLARRDLLEVASRVALRHHITIGEMVGDGRERPVAWARQALWCELFGYGHWSYVALGRLFGRDHTTVMIGVRAHLARTGVAA